MSSDFFNIAGTDVSPDVNSFSLESSIFSLLGTPIDAKLCNYFQLNNSIVVETIAEYLERILPGARTPGAIITILLPKVGYVPNHSYTITDFGAALSNFDVKFYHFKEGVADGNFIEIEFGAGVTEVFTEDNGYLPRLLELRYRKNGTVYPVTTLRKLEGIIYGGKVFWNGGLSFTAQATVVGILGTVYFVSQDTVILDAADPTYPRIDVILVNTSREVTILKGTPSANPQKPTVDPETEVELTYILIPAGATQPDGMTDEVVFDENLEWTATAYFVTVNFNSLVSPYSGTKCADVGSIGTGDGITFEKGSALNRADYESLILTIKLKAATTRQHSLLVRFFLGGNIVSTQVSVPFISSDLTWQSIVIELSEFSFSNIQFDAIELRWNKSGTQIDYTGFYLDYIKLQKGIVQPVFNDTIELTGDVIAKGKTGEQIPAVLKDVITPGTFGGATKSLNIQVDSKGRIIAISENTISAGGGITDAPADGNKYARKNNAWVVITEGTKPKQVTGKTLSSASWTLVSGLYEQSISDANITATSIVEVIPNNADIATVIAAVILPETDSSAGSVKVYAQNVPTANIGCTINIYETA